MEYMEFSAKTVADAITDACQKFTVTSDKLDYVVENEGSAGFLGIGAKQALIKARVKSDNEVAASDIEVAPVNEKKVEEVVEVSGTLVEEQTKKFLQDVFKAMNMTVTIDAKFRQADQTLEVELSGPEMGVLIGKRGQTLDSLQYLISLVVNKGTAEYIRVKVDTENYRQRRKETLENLAKNISYKVKRTKRPVSLEPMNPYERRIIHAALQNDRFVTTHSEGEEPFRRVVVTLKR